MTQLNCLENGDGPIGDGKPDNHCLDREIVPGVDEKPPSGGAGKAESPPVDEAAGCGEKNNRKNPPTHHEDDEIAGQPSCTGEIHFLKRIESATRTKPPMRELGWNCKRRRMVLVSPT